ncbi:amino acid ABC transporter permease [Martelella alba]|uniref:amino acid ABC transporter permease n=1 Tax=Martelella alba TaxID=2590451 RepID=UPI0015E85036|nr:ABC transporter permease subunit [Martelella alba]
MRDFVLLATVLVFFALLALNVLDNMHRAGLTPGFDFLGQRAGFDVSEALFRYSADSAYVRVLLVGVTNTLFLAAISLILATAAGLLVGLASIAPSKALRMLAQAYVELFRNIPKLLILLVLYVAAVSGLPQVRQAFSVGPFHLSNRSVVIPLPINDMALWLHISGLLISTLLVTMLVRHNRRLRERTGDAPQLLTTMMAVYSLPPIALALLSMPLSWSVPVLSGFDFRGGARLSLQFMVIALTLGLYHGAQIAEVIRGGIAAIAKGQIEAARALGLSSLQVTRLIVLPQTMRIIVPPINNQYVNLIKNTSIAIAVGYSDLMSVTGTIINQTFRPLEMMLVTMAIYLLICLGLTSALNRVSERLRMREGR